MKARPSSSTGTPWAISTFCDGLVEGLLVFALDRQADQHLDVLSTLCQDVYGADHIVQRHAFLAQRLCAFRLIPDIRLFQLGIDLF